MGQAQRRQRRSVERQVNVLEPHGFILDQIHRQPEHRRDGEYRRFWFVDAEIQDVEGKYREHEIRHARAIIEADNVKNSTGYV